MMIAISKGVEGDAGSPAAFGAAQEADDGIGAARKKFGYSWPLERPSGTRFTC